MIDYDSSRETIMKLIKRNAQWHKTAEIAKKEAPCRMHSQRSIGVRIGDLHSCTVNIYTMSPDDIIRMKTAPCNQTED
jgi:hypothetical protein